MCVCVLRISWTSWFSTSPAGKGNNLAMGLDTHSICLFVDYFVQKAPSWSFPPLVVQLDPFFQSISILLPLAQKKHEQWVTSLVGAGLHGRERRVGHMWCPAGPLWSPTAADPAPWETGAHATHVVSCVKKTTIKTMFLLLQGKLQCNFYWARRHNLGDCSFYVVTCRLPGGCPTS